MSETAHPGLHARIRGVFELGWRKRLPVIMQSEATECGLACIAMSAEYHGLRSDMHTLRQQFPISSRGSSVKDLAAIASGLKFSTRTIRIELEELPYLERGAILHWKLSHFVVFDRVVTKGRGDAPHAIVIHDPAGGRMVVPWDEVSSSFTGIAVEMRPAHEFRPKTQTQAITLRHLVGGVDGLAGSVLQIVALALTLEVFALAAPFFLQWVVDSAIVSADRGLLSILAIGFALLLVVQTVLGTFRSWMVLYLSTHTNLQWLDNVFSHLIRLPMQYFEKRHLGDVISRFNAVQTIQATLSASFLEGVLDGLMTIATLVMLSIYSMALTGIVLAFIAAYGLLRWALYRPLRQATLERIGLRAREQSLFLESIRGIQSIKLFNHQDQRRSRWFNALAAATNRDIATQRLTLVFTASHTLLAGLENIVIVWVGATMVIDNRFSVGMLYAYLAYRLTFTSRLYALIDKFLEVRMLGLQGERLADILMTAREDARVDVPGGEEDAPTLLREQTTNVDIEVRDLSFRYSPQEPWVVRNMNLHVAAGESVALTGPSGCGKTTFLKILLGLLDPTEGEVLVGGIPIRKFGLENYRSLVGAVMQDDQLFGGTLGSNIAFFDEPVDQERVRRCAEIAGVAKDIDRLPMGYLTLVGDMGVSLSGGQRQRILLARALYKQPQILFLDEATSHLDVAKEREVNQAIAALTLTRILIAHRPETIKSAARIVEFANGGIVRDFRKTEHEPKSDELKA